MLATSYGQRPSAILEIDDQWAAYQFDVAVHTVGQREVNRQQRKAYEKQTGKGSKSQPVADAQPMPSEMIRRMAKKSTP